MVGVTRSDIVMPSHWTGQDQVLIIAKTRGGPGHGGRVQRGSHARFAPPADPIVRYEEPWKMAHGAKRLARSSHQDVKSQIQTTSMVQGVVAEEAERIRVERGVRRRVEWRRQEAEKRELTRRRGEQIHEPYHVQQRAVQQRQGRLRMVAEAPLHEKIVFLPSLPEAKALAKASWACDVAPPRSPWEELDVRRRVESLNDDQEIMQFAMAAIQKENPDEKSLLKKLKRRKSQAMGRAPQASAFRDIVREDVSSLQHHLPPIV